MFERHGTALSYVEFEDLCLHELPVALSKDQVRRPDPPLFADMGVYPVPFRGSYATSYIPTLS